jgi:alpha-N-arabinofuranosidase
MGFTLKQFLTTGVISIIPFLFLMIIHFDFKNNKIAIMLKNKIVFIVIFFLSPPLFSQNLIILNPGNAKDTINKNIYGHFAEDLGRCIYGGFYVGDSNANIPNQSGIRLDIIDALKKLKIPVLRWPGGCYADHYHWRNGIGPKDKRINTENVSWGNVRENNGFGTHEFLNLCETLHADPYLALNVGGGTVQEAEEWVQYANHANGKSQLTDLRLQNGRATPWNVKFWGIGNESWDCGGHMSVEYYTSLYKQYVTLITSYSNREGLYRIAVGPGTEDFKWTEALMRDIPRKLIEGISIHHYSVIDWSKKGSSTDFTESEYFSTLEQAYRMEKMVSGNIEIMDKYDPEKKVGLVVDEWGGWYDTEPGADGASLYQQNTMRDAMIAGLTLNILNNHCDRVRMANLAQCINVLQAVILTKEEKMLLTPTYHVMEMYNVHQGALMLPLTISCNNYAVGEKSLKAISVSVSKDSTGAVHISLVNLDAHKAQELTIDLGYITPKTVTGRILHSDKLQDHNSFENPRKIKPDSFQGANVKGNKLSLKIPPFSVVVLELK